MTTDCAAVGLTFLRSQARDRQRRSLRSAAPGTPVGWGETANARERDEYPSNPRHTVMEWRGDSDAARNAKAWAADIPPAMR